MLIVKPEMVVAWRRQRLRLFGTKISQRQSRGRPEVNSQLRALIQKMAEANPRWGAPRIQGELLKLGIAVSQYMVARLMPKRQKPPSQTCRMSLGNHLESLVSIDFFAVPTATFQVLLVLVTLAQQHRRHLHQCGMHQHSPHQKSQ